MLLIRRAALSASLLVLAFAAPIAAPITFAADAMPQIAPWGVDLSGMDKSVKPGDDFFHFAGGTWMKNTTIPGDRTRWGSFDMLRDKSEQDVKETIEANDKESHAPGTPGQKVGDFNRAFMDTATIEAKGLAPAKPDLDAIAAAKTLDDVAALMAEPGLPVGGPFDIGETADSKDPSRYVIEVGQGGLGLPDRDYYLKDDKKFTDIRAAYVNYVTTMLTGAGYPKPEEAAKAIVALETELAKVSWERAKRRNRDLTYNFNTRAQLVSYAPDFPWDAYLNGLGIGQFDRFVLGENDAIQKETAIFKQTPVETWKAYMTFHYLDSYAAVLPKAFDDASFAFNKVLSGQEKQRDRWKRSVSAMNGALGEAVGELYVQRHFTPTAKAQMLALVETLREGYRKHITALDWMGADTKKEALAKLDAFRVKIAYPDKWRDYSAFEVKPDDALGNMKRAAIFNWNRDKDRLDKPVDKDEWGMTPQTVNAYYNPTFNEVVFPAAILQPPFFDPNADIAVNYGAIGAVIGHEMGHGFDDQGAKSDATGVLRNWWTKEDVDRFHERVKQLGDEYSAFEPLPGFKINGELTMGENIGDLGGISVAFDAYHDALKGKDAAVIEGYTGDQRFFLAFAQVWRSLIRDEALQNQVMTDPHSPAQYRTNGVVPNVDAWYTAFDVKPGDKLYIAPEKRVHIW